MHDMHDVGLSKSTVLPRHATVTAGNIMHSPSIKNIDLNLLKVFDAVFRERHLARAAEQLGMSQPAASHALTRLRHALSDDLFVRSARGMLPTARAEQLAVPIRQALSYLEVGLQSDTFDPATSKQTFKMAFDNCSAIALTSRIVEVISNAAPGVSLHIRPSGTINIDSLIDAADLDLFVGRPGETRERFASDELRNDDFVVVHPASIPWDNVTLTLEEFVGTPHLQLSSTGDDTSFVDQWLAEQTLAREVKHSIPLLGYTAALQQQKMLVVMRRPIAKAIRTDGNLVIRELPFRSPRISTCMRWHKRLDSKPAHQWLRETISAAVAGD
jgi:DNA-binding transcriptional LysR family regulator